MWPKFSTVYHDGVEKTFRRSLVVFTVLDKLWKGYKKNSSDWLVHWIKTRVILESLQWNRNGVETLFVLYIWTGTQNLCCVTNSIYFRVLGKRKQNKFFPDRKYISIKAFLCENLANAMCYYIYSLSWFIYFSMSRHTMAMH